MTINYTFERDRDEKVNVSGIDADCLAIAENRNKILLTDDGYTGEIAERRTIKVFDLKTFLEACIMAGLIKTSDEIRQIISDLRKRDFYEFSDEDKTTILSFFKKISQWEIFTAL